MLKLYIRPVCFQCPEEERIAVSSCEEPQGESKNNKRKRKPQQIHCGGSSAPAYAAGRTDPLCRRIFWAGRTWKPRLKKEGFSLIKPCGSIRSGSTVGCPGRCGCGTAEPFLAGSPQPETCKADINGSGMELVERCRG